MITRRNIFDWIVWLIIGACVAALLATIIFGWAIAVGLYPGKANPAEHASTSVPEFQSSRLTPSGFLPVPHSTNAATADTCSIISRVEEPAVLLALRGPLFALTVSMAKLNQLAGSCVIAGARFYSSCPAKAIRRCVSPKLPASCAILEIHPMVRATAQDACTAETAAVHAKGSVPEFQSSRLTRIPAVDSFAFKPFPYPETQPDRYARHARAYASPPATSLHQAKPYFSQSANADAVALPASIT